MIFGDLPLYNVNEAQATAEYQADGRYRISIKVSIPKVEVPIRVRIIPAGGKELVVQGLHTGTATDVWVKR